MPLVSADPSRARRAHYPVSRLELDQAQPAAEVRGRSLKTGSGAVYDRAKLLVTQVVERKTSHQPCFHLLVAFENRCFALVDLLDSLLPKGQAVERVGRRSQRDRHVPINCGVREALNVDLADQVAEVIQRLVTAAVLDAEARQIDSALKGLSIVGEKLPSNRRFVLFGGLATDIASVNNATRVSLVALLLERLLHFA